MGFTVHMAGASGNQQRVRARVRAAGKALEGDDGHTIAPIHRDDTQDKAIVCDVFKETAGTSTSTTSSHASICRGPIDTTVQFYNN